MESSNDSIEIQSLKTSLVQSFLDAELISVSPFYNAIAYEILVENKTFAQVALSHHLTEQKVRALFLKTYRRMTDGICDLQHLLSQFKKILQKSELSNAEATYNKKGLTSEQRYIESLGVEYTPELEMNLALKIGDCNLEERIKNICRANDIVTVKDLVMLGRKTFYSTRNCGKKTLITIDKFLESKGLFWLA